MINVFGCYTMLRYICIYKKKKKKKIYLYLINFFDRDQIECSNCSQYVN